MKTRSSRSGKWIVVLLIAGGGSFLAGCYHGFGHYSLGVAVTTLPYGHYRFHWDGYPYYYHDGYFFRHGRGGYVVVRAPYGAVVPRVSRRARSYRRGGVRYKEHRGVHYRAFRRDGRTMYRVMRPRGRHRY